MRIDEAKEVLSDNGFPGEIPDQPSIAECDHICHTIGAPYIVSTHVLDVPITDILGMMATVNEALQTLNPEWDPMRLPGEPISESVDQIASLMTENPDVNTGGKLVHRKGRVFPFDEIQEGLGDRQSREWEHYRADTPPKPFFRIFVPSPEGKYTKLSGPGVQSPYGYYSYTVLWPMTVWGSPPAGQPGAFGGWYVQRSHKTLTINKENVKHLTIGRTRVF